MGFASCYEDNLDARGESARGRHRHLTLSKVKTKKTQQIESMESQFRLQRSADSTRTSKPSQPKPSRPKPLQSKSSRPKPSPGTRQRIRRRGHPKTPHVPVMKTQYVTTEEIQLRIQHEIIRQSILKE